MDLTGEFCGNLEKKASKLVTLDDIATVTTPLQAFHNPAG